MSNRSCWRYDEGSVEICQVDVVPGNSDFKVYMSLLPLVEESFFVTMYWWCFSFSIRVDGVSGEKIDDEDRTKTTRKSKTGWNSLEIRGLRHMIWQGVFGKTLICRQPLSGRVKIYRSCISVLCCTVEGLKGIPFYAVCKPPSNPLWCSMQRFLILRVHSQRIKSKTNFKYLLEGSPTSVYLSLSMHVIFLRWSSTISGNLSLPISTQRIPHRHRASLTISFDGSF